MKFHHGHSHRHRRHRRHRKHGPLVGKQMQYCNCVTRLTTQYTLPYQELGTWKHVTQVRWQQPQQSNPAGSAQQAPESSIGFDFANSRFLLAGRQWEEFRITGVRAHWNPINATTQNYGGTLGKDCTLNLCYVFDEETTQTNPNKRHRTPDKVARESVLATRV